MARVGKGAFGMDGFNHPANRGAVGDVLSTAQLSVEDKPRPGVPDHYSELYEHAPSGLVTFNTNAVVTELNLTFARLLEIDRAKLLQMPFTIVVVPEDIPDFLSHLRRCRQTSKGKIGTELHLRKKSGGGLPVQLLSIPFNKNGETVYHTAIFDLTERKHIEDQLKEAKDYAESIVQAIYEPLALLDNDLRIVSMNRAFNRTFRLKVHEATGQIFTNLENLSWNDSGQLEKILRQQTPVENCLIQARLSVTGEKLFLMLTAKRLLRPSGLPPLLLVVLYDVTMAMNHEREEARLVEEIQAAYQSLEKKVQERTHDLAVANENLKAMSARVLAAHESERRHLAHELHDDLGQVITSLNLFLERQIHSLPKEKQKDFREAHQIGRELLERVRQISLDLRPTLLNDLGFLPAVQSHLKSYRKHTGIAVRLDDKNFSEDRVATETGLVLFRVLQEALSNIARYAQVKTAKVTLASEEDSCLMFIEDKGVGCDLNVIGKFSSGIAGMRERVELSGGKFSIESAFRKGTRIAVSLPLVQLS